MKIFTTAIQCNSCKDIIYSRANHDFHYCGCGETFVDGGNQPHNISTGNIISGYMRYGCQDLASVESKVVCIGAFNSVLEARQALYIDWNTHGGKYGTSGSI